MGTSNAIFIVGHTSYVRPDAHDLLLPMSPDGRLAKPNPAKDTPEEMLAKQQKLNASVDEKWAKFDTDVATKCRLTASLGDIAAYEVHSQEMFVMSPTPGVDVPVEFVEWMLKACGTGTPEFCGFDIIRFLRMLHMDWLRSGKGWDRQTLALTQCCVVEPKAFDPYTAMSEISMLATAATAKLFRALNIHVADDYQIHVNAEEDMALCAELATRLGLFIPQTEAKAYSKLCALGAGTSDVAPEEVAACAS